MKHIVITPLVLALGKLQSAIYCCNNARITPADNNSNVLEIDSKRYTAALLANIAKTVTAKNWLKRSVLDPETIDKLGYKNVHIVHGDGYMGWEERAPYDATCDLCCS